MELTVVEVGNSPQDMAAGVKCPRFANGSRGIPVGEQDDLRVGEPPGGYGIAQSLSQCGRTRGHLGGSWCAWTTDCRAYIYAGSHSKVCLMMNVWLVVAGADCVADYDCGWLYPWLTIYSETE